MSETNKRCRQRTPEQRERFAAYMRSYRAANPERCKAWRQAYILRAAERLRAAADPQGGGQDAGD